MTSILLLSNSYIYSVFSNILLSPAYGVYISQLIRYARACSTYDQFLSRGRLLIYKLMLQGFLHSRLMSAFRKFYGRYNDLIYNYNFHWAICCLTFFIPMLRLYLAPRLWQRITRHSWSWDWANGGCDWSTGNAYSFYAPDPTSDVSPGVRVSLIFTVDCSIYLNWTLILTAYFSVCLIKHTDFDSGLFCLLNFSTLILATDFCVWNGATGR
jgi:hypothetical protein